MTANSHAPEPTTRPTEPAADLVVIGLGYVGLPLALEATRAGLAVVGLDVDTGTVRSLNAGLSHVEDISADALAAMLAGGFRATTDPAVLRAAAVAVVCVPTPLGEGRPDLRSVCSAMETVGRFLVRGQLVVLESTTYPGTTQDVVRPILEAASGLRAGADFALAFSPERIDPGNPTWGLANTPKVVGGLTAGCTAAAAAFYGKFVTTVVETAGPAEAETAKLLENTYRHVTMVGGSVTFTCVSQFGFLGGWTLWADSFTTSFTDHAPITSTAALTATTPSPLALPITVPGSTYVINGYPWDKANDGVLNVGQTTAHHITQIDVNYTAVFYGLGIPPVALGRCRFQVGYQTAKAAANWNTISLTKVSGPTPL